MTIYFQNKKEKRFYITFGLKSEIHSQICLISWGTEWLDENNQVEFATMNYILNLQILELTPIQELIKLNLPIKQKIKKPFIIQIRLNIEKTKF